MSKAEALNEARDLAELLIASSDAAKSLFAEIANELDLPVSVTRALCALDEPSPMTVLANRLRCDKSYITPIADQLEALALVKRVPGPDRRTKVLALTSKGEVVRSKLESRVTALSPAMTALTASERSALKSILSKIAEVQ